MEQRIQVGRWGTYLEQTELERRDAELWELERQDVAENELRVLGGHFGQAGAIREAVLSAHGLLTAEPQGAAEERISEECGEGNSFPRDGGRDSGRVRGRR